MIPFTCPCCEVPHPPHHEDCTLHADVAEFARDWDEVSFLRAEIARLREDRRWIPVGERLPDRSVAVLVRSSQGTHRASLDSYGQWLDDEENPGKRVTHWMPLPSPPGGEVDG
jgi:hypothetical protein